MPARLTVVIPMYNSEPTIAEAIASVQGQTFEDWRMIVVNDGSTDAGPRVVEELARDDSRISMVTQENRGLAGARNTGLEAAIDSGSEFVGFLDSDDWMYPGAYDALVRAAAETGASYAGYELCDQHGRSLGRQSPVSAPIVGLDEQIEWNRTATHAHLFSRHMIGKCRFDERLKVVEDYDMWLRLAVRGERWKGVDRIVAAYRLRPSSMSKQFAPMCRCYERVLRKAFDEAREFGWEGRIDLSETRFRRVVGHSALMYATMEAFLDPIPSKPRGAALLEGSSRPERFTGAQLAQAASTALLFGACTAPVVDGASERTWLVALRQWWVRCAEEKWIGYEEIEPAMHELSRKVVHPDEIAAGMLKMAQARGHAAEQGVVVVGLDRNSRRLVRACAAKGWRVLAVDAGADAREAALLEPTAGVRVVREEELARGVADGFAGACWMTGLVGAIGTRAMESARRAAGVATDRTVEMWDEHRERLGSANLSLMRRALASPGRMAG
jgi:glycosyltransferase involved in cell wall biosynthesis